MAISFPATPNIDDIYSVGDRSWQWNGTYWEVQPTPAQTFSVSDTAPGSPEAGDIWYRSDTSQTLIYYDSTWVEIGHSANIANFIQDTDTDTKIEVEETSDSDSIKFTTAGTSRLEINSSGHVVPSQDVTYDLGSADYRFRDLYLSGNTIDLGGATISYDGTNLHMGAIKMDPSGTGANMMSSGTTAERPASPTAGMFRFNETTGEPEWYSTYLGDWVNFRSEPVVNVSYLVIAGGGGGGYDASGGGGAGGYRNSWSNETSGGGASTESTVVISLGTFYSVTVGAGGSGASTNPNNGGNGSNSVFDTITSIGGGGGGDADGPSVAESGGSGGGAGYNRTAGAGTASQGYAGGGGNSLATNEGFEGGGGGGASEAGGTNSAGEGGDGLASFITGVSVVRAGGGGGAVGSSLTVNPGGAGGGGYGAKRYTSAAASGVDNTGSGGGGGDLHSGAYPAGNGGSGVVILRYRGPSPTVSAGLTSTTTTVGIDKVTVFTAGTGTVSWT